MATILLPAALQASGPDVFELASGVVVDRAGSRVYTMHQERSVEALDLRSGSSLWISDAAEKPLWVATGVVYAQRSSAAGSLQVMFLDSADGVVEADSLEIPLPFGVKPLIDEKRGQSFSIHFQGGKQPLSASWDFLDQSAMPKPWDDAPAPKVLFERGSALLDPVSKQVEPVSPGSLSARARATSAIGLLLDQGVLQEPFWLVGSVAAGIVEIPGASGEREILLQRWDTKTGSALAEVTLFSGRVVSRMVSADQQHFLVGSASGESANGIIQYRWSIFSLESGDRVAEILMGRSATPFSIVDGDLIQLSPPFGHLVGGVWEEVPPMVRKLDLQTGTQLWASPIRDTLYRGPVPSSRKNP